VELGLTEGPGDATARAGRIDADTHRIVVVGGDGTVNEVVNGLADPARTPLVALGTGTANILAHELGYPYDPEGVARIVESDVIQRLDLGIAGGKRFLAVVSSGFDALVTRTIAENRTSTLGYLGYARPILRTLGRYRPPNLTVRVDGEEVEGGLVIVSNTRNYGGLFTMADTARCDSGHLDVLVLERATYLPLVRSAIGGLTGGISRQKGVVHRTGTAIEIASEDEAPVEVDGDYFGSTPIEISMDGRQVPFVVAPG
jgi:YegS/Rv2252/BmrU family lipid kinase